MKRTISTPGEGSPSKTALSKKQATSKGSVDLKPHEPRQSSGRSLDFMDWGSGTVENPVEESDVKPQGRSLDLFEEPNAEPSEDKDPKTKKSNEKDLDSEEEEELDSEEEELESEDEKEQLFLIAEKITKTLERYINKGRKEQTQLWEGYEISFLMIAHYLTSNNMGTVDCNGQIYEPFKRSAKSNAKFIIQVLVQPAFWSDADIDFLDHMCSMLSLGAKAYKELKNGRDFGTNIRILQKWKSIAEKLAQIESPDSEAKYFFEDLRTVAASGWHANPMASFRRIDCNVERYIKLMKDLMKRRSSAQE